MKILENYMLSAVSGGERVRHVDATASQECNLFACSTYYTDGYDENLSTSQEVLEALLITSLCTIVLSLAYKAIVS